MARKQKSYFLGVCREVGLKPNLMLSKGTGARNSIKRSNKKTKTELILKKCQKLSSKPSLVKKMTVGNSPFAMPFLLQSQRLWQSMDDKIIMSHVDFHFVLSLI